MFVKNLEEMAVTTRPIHCGDSKRQQFFIKNENKWEEDKKHEKITKQLIVWHKNRFNKSKNGKKTIQIGQKVMLNTRVYANDYHIMSGKTEQENKIKNIKISLTESLLVNEGDKVVKY